LDGSSEPPARIARRDPRACPEDAGGKLLDFDWTPEQERLRDEVVVFAHAQLNKDLVRRDTDHEFSTEAWKKCADFGIQGLPVPEAYGGTDADPLSIIFVMEALGYACRDNGLIFSLNAQMWSCEIPLVRFGSDEQKGRYLPGLCDGTLIGVQGMTEPDSGSDAFSLSTTATKVDDGWVLRGTKTFITNAPIADLFVVFASTDRSMGFAGLSAFVVERETKGVSVGATFGKMGLRTSPMSEVVLSDCFVPDDALLGASGAGMAIFNSSMDWERSHILASSVGTMQRHLERSIAYARQRTQFGQRIGKFQAVSHKIADMKVRLETSRLLLYRLGWLRSQGRPTAMESAIVKLHLSESMLQSGLDTLQIHGAYGYMQESEVERDVRDAIAGRIYSGTSEIQRNLIAGYLGL
jgi:alkylation response protein AidB-like acyl-CoA dehydrogenase